MGCCSSKQPPINTDKIYSSNILPREDVLSDEDYLNEVDNQEIPSMPVGSPNKASMKDNEILSSGRKSNQSGRKSNQSGRKSNQSGRKSNQSGRNERIDSTKSNKQPKDNNYKTAGDKNYETNDKDKQKYSNHKSSNNEHGKHSYEDNNKEHNQEVEVDSSEYSDVYDSKNKRYKPKENNKHNRKENKRIDQRESDRYNKKENKRIDQRGSDKEHKRIDQRRSNKDDKRIDQQENDKQSNKERSKINFDKKYKGKKHRKHNQNDRDDKYRNREHDKQRLNDDDQISTKVSNKSDIGSSIMTNRSNKISIFSHNNLRLLYKRDVSKMKKLPITFGWKEDIFYYIFWMPEINQVMVEFVEVYGIPLYDFGGYKNFMAYCKTKKWINTSHKYEEFCNAIITHQVRHLQSCIFRFNVDFYISDCFIDNIGIERRAYCIFGPLKQKVFQAFDFYFDGLRDEIKKFVKFSKNHIFYADIFDEIQLPNMATNNAIAKRTYHEDYEKLPENTSYISVNSNNSKKLKAKISFPNRKRRKILKPFLMKIRNKRG